jgi:beta-N-acetylhexosaminidase
MPARRPVRQPVSRPVAVLLAALLAGALLAACSGGPPADDGAALEPIGTEAWLASPSAAASPSDPTAAGAVQVDPDATAVAPPPTAPASAPAGPLDTGGGVAAVLAGMTLEQKVGQVFAVTVVGDDAAAVSQAAAAANTALYGVATPAEVVARYHLGGVAYFDHDQGAGTSNVDDLAATARLSAGLQAAAAADTGVGLLIGADQEGGRVVRLRDPAVTFPAAAAIGATGRTDLAREAGAVTAAQVRAVGVNWVYAPVADVALDPANEVIGDRSFGPDPAAVAGFVRATAEGLAAGGVLPTLKHFPGHGDTAVDSHSALPTIEHDRQTLAAVDLPPFAVAAALSGEGTPVSVMLGHLAVPAIDPSGRPATISPAIVDLLRAPPSGGGLGDGLGFDGLVVTDAFNMGALDGFGDSGSLAVQALAAGVDVVLMPTDLPAAWTAVLEAVRSGALPEARLDEAVARILQAKAALGVLSAAAAVPGDPAALGSAEALAIRQAVRDACGC